MSQTQNGSSPSKSQIMSFVRKFVKLSDIERQCKKSKINVIKKSGISKAKPRVVKPESIIRIVPTNIKTENIRPKNTVQGYLAEKSNCVKSAEVQKAIPSTSTIKCTPVLTDHEYNAPASKETTDDNSMFEEYENEINTEEPSRDIDQESEIESILYTSEIPDSNKRSRVSIVPSQNKAHSEQCCCSCRETLNLILRQQEEILRCFKYSFNFIPMARKLDLLPHMPFNDVNDFVDFDESLTHENVQSQFMIKLKKLLVSSEQRSVSNIMSSILTNELCKSISWVGIRDTIAFGTTNMVGMIVELVQEYNNVDIDIVKSRIAEWLRRFSDRISNEVRKLKKKAEKQGAV